MEARHLVSIVVIAVLAGLRMALVMFPAPTPTTLRSYDSMSRMSAMVVAAIVVVAAMTCFALAILKQQTIRSFFSRAEVKSKRRRAAKRKQQLQQGRMAVVVLIVLFVGVGTGLVVFSPSIHDNPHTPSPGLSQDHEDGSSAILAIAAGSVGAAVVILAGAYVLMRQTSRASEMQRASRKRRRNVRAQSS